MRHHDSDCGAAAYARPPSELHTPPPAGESVAARMPDVQARADPRCLAIRRVGVKRLRWPLDLRIGGRVQQVAAEWDLAVALPAHVRGAHLSRFIAWLDQLPSPIDAVVLHARVLAMLAMLGARNGHVDVRFPFFLRKRAPVSGMSSLLDYQGRWIADIQDEKVTVWAEVGVPVKSLCPCSKEISDYGAHNQRSLVTIRVEVAKPVEWLELVRFAEDSASSEIWPLLKRSDEKWVTERAYNNPKFVEDLVRDVTVRLEADPRIGRYSVEVENFESIHNHSAYARIEGCAGAAAAVT